MDFFWKTSGSDSSLDQTFQLTLKPSGASAWIVPGTITMLPTANAANDAAERYRSRQPCSQHRLISEESTHPLQKHSSGHVASNWRVRAGNEAESLNLVKGLVGAIRCHYRHRQIPCRSAKLGRKNLGGESRTATCVAAAAHTQDTTCRLEPRQTRL